MRDFLRIAGGCVVIFFLVVIISVVISAPLVAIGVAIDKAACDNMEEINGGEFGFMYRFPVGCLTQAQDGRWVPVSSIVISDSGE